MNSSQSEFDIGCHYAIITDRAVPLGACLTSYESEWNISRQYACNLNGQLTKQAFLGESCDQQSLEYVSVYADADLLFSSCGNHEYTAPCPYAVLTKTDCDTDDVDDEEQSQNDTVDLGHEVAVIVNTHIPSSALSFVRCSADEMWFWSHDDCASGDCLELAPHKKIESGVCGEHGRYRVDYCPDPTDKRDIKERVVDLLSVQLDEFGDRLVLQFNDTVRADAVPSDCIDEDFGLFRNLRENALEDSSCHVTFANNRSAVIIELDTASTLAFDDTLYVDIRPALSGLVKASSDLFKVHVGWTQTAQTAPLLDAKLSIAGSEVTMSECAVRWVHGFQSQWKGGRALEYSWKLMRKDQNGADLTVIIDDAIADEFKLGPLTPGEYVLLMKVEAEFVPVSSGSALNVHVVAKDNIADSSLAVSIDGPSEVEQRETAYFKANAIAECGPPIIQWRSESRLKFQWFVDDERMINETSDSLALRVLDNDVMSVNVSVRVARNGFESSSTKEITITKPKIRVSIASVVYDALTAKTLIHARVLNSERFSADELQSVQWRWAMYQTNDERKALRWADRVELDEDEKECVAISDAVLGDDVVTSVMVTAQMAGHRDFAVAYVPKRNDKEADVDDVRTEADAHNRKLVCTTDDDSIWAFIEKYEWRVLETLDAVGEEGDVAWRDVTHERGRRGRRCMAKRAMRSVGVSRERQNR